MKLLRGLEARLKALEGMAAAGGVEARALAEGRAIVTARLHGVISEAEAERQLAQIPGYPFEWPIPAALQSRLDDARIHWQRAVEAMTPKQREEDARAAGERAAADEADRAVRVAADPTRYGETYAVLVPERVQEQTRAVVLRAGLPLGELA